MSKYIFITGNGHSGSTLLDLILGTHPEIVSIGELKQFERYVTEKKDCTCGKQVVECSFWQDVRDGILKERGVDPFMNVNDFPLSISRSKSVVVQLIKQLNRLVILNSPPPLARFLSKLLGRDYMVATNSISVYDQVLKLSGASKVVDSSKSPIIMKFLQVLVPKDTKAIHILRDGRAVLNSNLKKGKNLRFASVGWVKTIKLLGLLSVNLPENQYLTIRYEDLCTDTESVLTKICKFLEVEYHHNLLDFRGIERHNIDGNRMRYESTAKIKLDEKWRKTLSSSQLAEFNEIAGALNNKLGYD